MRESVDGFVAALAERDPAAGIALLDALEDRGRDLRIFLDQVVDVIRERLLAGLSSPGVDDASLLRAARRLGSIDPTRLGPGGLRLQLELALLDAGPAVAAVTVAAPPRQATRAGAATPTVAPRAGGAASSPGQRLLRSSAPSARRHPSPSPSRRRSPSPGRPRHRRRPRRRLRRPRREPRASRRRRRPCPPPRRLDGRRRRHHRAEPRRQAAHHGMPPDRRRGKHGHPRLP